MEPNPTHAGGAVRYFDRARYGAAAMEAYVESERAILGNPNVMLWGPHDGRWMVTYNAPTAPTAPMSDTEYALRRLGVLD